MGIYEELQARGLIAQVTDEEEIRELINNGKAPYYIGFDPTADSLHVGHFMALCLMKRLQMAGNKPVSYTHLLVGLFVAMALCSDKMWARIITSIFLIPMIMAPVAVGTLWRMMLDLSLIHI